MRERTRRHDDVHYPLQGRGKRATPPKRGPMYHFAHIAAYYTQQSRSIRGLIDLPIAHVSRYYRLKSQTYRWYCRW